MVLLGDVGNVPATAGSDAPDEKPTGSYKRTRRGSSSGVVQGGPVQVVKMANEPGPVLQQMQSSYDFGSPTSLLLTSMSYEASYLAEQEKRKELDVQRKVRTSPQNSSWTWWTQVMYLCGACAGVRRTSGGTAREIGGTPAQRERGTKTGPMRATIHVFSECEKLHTTWCTEFACAYTPSRKKQSCLKRCGGTRISSWRC